MFQNLTPQSVSYFALPCFYELKMREQSAWDMQSEQDKVERIVSFICEKRKISWEQIKSHFRGQEVVFTRQLCIYIVRQRTHLSLKAIGEVFDRDHTSIIHSLEAIENYLSTGHGRASIVSLFMSALY